MIEICAALTVQAHSVMFTYTVSMNLTNSKKASLNIRSKMSQQIFNPISLIMALINLLKPDLNLISTYVLCEFNYTYSNETK